MKKYGKTNKIKTSIAKYQVVFNYSNSFRHSTLLLIDTSNHYLHIFLVLTTNPSTRLFCRGYYHLKGKVIKGTQNLIE